MQTYEKLQKVIKMNNKQATLRTDSNSQIVEDIRL